jgi:trk system potassium uptake protein TrkH
MHPKLSTNAKWIWSIYLGLTVACVLSYWAAGVNWFDSVNYAMTTTATGGFSTHNDSASFFVTPAVEYVSALFQFLSGINFTLLYLTLFKFRFRDMLKNSEFKVYLGVVIVATIWIMYLLMTRVGYGFEHALRSSLFQVISFMTTTGMFSDNAAAWPHITWVIIGLLMFLGASAGSTSGGFKCVRGLMAFEVMRNEFRRILHPNAVLPVKVSGQPVPQSKITTLMAFLAIYVSICMLCSTIMVTSGIDMPNAIGISLGLISNVGPSLEQAIGEPMSWNDLSMEIKWICSFLMLVGRLEIISVLVLFTRSYWKDN